MNSEINFSNVDEYIAQFPDDIQKRLLKVRAIVKENAPGAEEVISYQMPAYKLHGILVYFAAFKNHIGFYATPSANLALQAELSQYKMGKGSIQFPNSDTLPETLIAKLVKFKVEENLNKLALKKAKKK